MTNDERADALPQEIREWLADLSDDRHSVISARISKYIEDRVGVWDDDTDPVLVETAFIETIQYMHLHDQLMEAVEEGTVVVTGVTSDGELTWSVPMTEDRNEAS
jgi:uncharacterized membrane protein